MYNQLRPILLGLVIFFAISAWLLPTHAQRLARTEPSDPPTASSKSLKQNGVQAQVPHRQQADQPEFEASAGGGGHLSVGGAGALLDPAADADAGRIHSSGTALAFAQGPHPESAGLVINATFDTSITSNPNSAAIEAMINQAIGLYQSQFSDPITVSILFRYSTTLPDGTPVGAGFLARSNYIVYGIPWSTFITALTADSKTANDAAANISLPVTPLSTNVLPSSANGRALGLNTPPAMFADGHVGAGGPFDGIVTLNPNQPFLFNRSGGVGPGQFDAQRSTEHEIDEVLGFGSFLDLNGGTNVRPQDLFSWSASGVRNITTSGSRYFSINSGLTDIVGFNQNPGGDRGDWLSGPCPQTTPFVQNANSCDGQFSDVSLTSPEGINLDVIGYDLATTCRFSISPGSQSFQAAGGAGTINVTTATGCTWVASSSVPWITITSGSSGSSSGVVGYSVALNTSTDPRSGMLFAAGQQVTVSQAGGSGPIQLSLDDGSFELGTTLTGSSTVSGVNRFTPDHYPATLSQVQIFFGSQLGLSAGENITLLVGTNAGSSTDISGTSFQSLPASIGTLGGFSTYTVPSVTINSGDFVVGFRIAAASNVFPFSEDTSGQPQRRSYLSGDSSNFLLIDSLQGANSGNFGIRAVLSEPTAGGPIPSVANLSGDLEGRVLTLTGTAFDGSGDMTAYEITLHDLSNATVGDTGQQAINFGSSMGSYFTLQISNMNTFPSAVAATVSIIDRQGNRSPAISVSFGDSDPGGPGLVNMGLSDSGVLTVKGGPFFGNLQLEVNGDIVAPPLNIKVKGGGNKLKINGVNMTSGPNRVRVLADKFKSNIFVFSQ